MVGALGKDAINLQSVQAKQVAYSLLCYSFRSFKVVDSLLNDVTCHKVWD